MRTSPPFALLRGRHLDDGDIAEGDGTWRAVTLASRVTFTYELNPDRRTVQVACSAETRCAVRSCAALRLYRHVFHTP